MVTAFYSSHGELGPFGNVRDNPGDTRHDPAKQRIVCTWLSGTIAQAPSHSQPSYFQIHRRWKSRPRMQTSKFKLNSYSLGSTANVKMLRPSLHLTYPTLPIGSLVTLASCCSVISSAWLARKRWLFDFSRPTTWPRLGFPCRSNSTVYVCRNQYGVLCSMSLLTSITASPSALSSILGDP